MRRYLAGLALIVSIASIPASADAAMVAADDIDLTQGVPEGYRAALMIDSVAISTCGKHLHSGLQGNKPARDTSIEAMPLFPELAGLQADSTYFFGDKQLFQKDGDQYVSTTFAGGELDLQGELGNQQGTLLEGQFGEGTIRALPTSEEYGEKIIRRNRHFRVRSIEGYSFFWETSLIATNGILADIFGEGTVLYLTGVFNDVRTFNGKDFAAIGKLTLYAPGSTDTAVPEPATAGLLLISMVGSFAVRRRKQTD